MRVAFPKVPSGYSRNRIESHQLRSNGTSRPTSRGKALAFSHVDPKDRLQPYPISQTPVYNLGLSDHLLASMQKNNTGSLLLQEFSFPSNPRPSFWGPHTHFKAAYALEE